MNRTCSTLTTRAIESCHLGLAREIPCTARIPERIAHMQAIHATYTAGMVSEAARIPVSTLRRWCSSGRIGKRTRTRLWRRFSLIDALRVATIADLGRRGFEIRQVAAALAGADEQLRRVIAGESSSLNISRRDLQVTIDLSSTWRRVGTTLRAHERAARA